MTAAARRPLSAEAFADDLARLTSEEAEARRQTARPLSPEAFADDLARLTREEAEARRQTARPWPPEAFAGDLIRLTREEAEARRQEWRVRQHPKDGMLYLIPCPDGCDICEGVPR